jgi:hypothetical protein
MANALSDSDFAATMAIGANDHRNWFHQFDQKGWILNGSRVVLAEADQRVQGWIHGALNHQPHNAEY